MHVQAVRIVSVGWKRGADLLHLLQQEWSAVRARHTLMFRWTATHTVASRPLVNLRDVGDTFTQGDAVGYAEKATVGAMKREARTQLDEDARASNEGWREGTLSICSE